MSRAEKYGSPPIQSYWDTSPLTVPFSQINFPALPTTLLASYRHAYRLPTPAAFTSPYNELILTRPSGIGKLSPTMAKVRGKRRVGKEHLALAVRKNFKERSVVEAEAAA